MKKIKKIIDLLTTGMWIVKTNHLAFSKKFLMLINYVVSFRNGVVVSYDGSAQSKVISLIKEVKNEVHTLMEINEAYNLFMAVKSVKKIRGDIAEVGVYRGGSAKIICEAKEKKILHLFDTFEGLPSPSKEDQQGYFLEGEFNSKLEDVKVYLKDYPDVYFYKGFFPTTAKSVKNNTFSLVNLDVDIYKSTLNCLKFFYPRMSKGGIIVLHDYVNAIGVRKAVDRFFKDKKEPIIEMSGSQCLAVKA